jgi:hypothetical protein
MTFDYYAYYNKMLLYVFLVFMLINDIHLIIFTFSGRQTILY